MELEEAERAAGIVAVAGQVDERGVEEKATEPVAVRRQRDDEPSRAAVRRRRPQLAQPVERTGLRDADERPIAGLVLVDEEPRSNATDVVKRQPGFHSDR